jgi:hypothetical protein
VYALFAAFAMGKFALHRLAQSAARELGLGPKGIQIDKSYGLTTLRDHHVDIGRPSESGAGQQSDVATVSHACNR